MFNVRFLLDTNFLMIPGQFKVDIFAELEKFGKPELYILDTTIKELEKISKGRGSDAKAARLALELVKMKNIKMVQAQNKSTDREILRLAFEKDFVVCTQDKKLKAKLIKMGSRVVTMRQKKFLIIYENFDK